MRSQASLAVLIPTHNRFPLFQRTLESVLACQRPEDRKVRLIVIENGVRVGVEECLRTTKSWLVPEYLYVQNGNKSLALNAAMDTLDDELAVFLDDDIQVESNLIKQYAEAADHNPNNCFFGGPFAADYVKEPPEWLLKYLPDSAKGWAPVTYESLIPGALWFIGFNWAAYTVDIKRAGGFNPDVGPGAKSGATGQETAMQKALVELGVSPVYIPGALVRHYVPEERCSPEWALERAFKNGVTTGINSNLDMSTSLLFGMPRWMLRENLELQWRALKAALTQDSEDVFQARYNLAQFRGTATGIKALLAQQNKRLK
ncbi:MAG: glycosyltransferase [Lamprobacter sp.]|uniref:glycosyltransferase n=1 Tax=Lamprobacter sp. TaxID=3100796 RepID=UPI002B259D64|nr:glycosyltransferase [Lamprobacter sp.]MEA3642635.1 glycosyltransferase [Lamprobacter sp.]